MNFEDLVKKINELDTSTESMQPPVQAVMAPASGPEYPDSGNVSLEELQAIKSLLGKMRGEEPDHDDAKEPQFDIPSDDVLLGDEPPNDTLLGELPNEEWANSPEAKLAKIAAVITTGDDLSSKGKEAPKVNGGGNPMQEALVQRLSKIYQEIQETEGKPKTMSRAAKGVMKYGKDGMKALAKAGKEGKDLDKIRDKYNKYD